MSLKFSQNTPHTFKLIQNRFKSITVIDIMNCLPNELPGGGVDGGVGGAPSRFDVLWFLMVVDGFQGPWWVP